MDKRNFLWALCKQIFIYALIALEARIVASILGYVWHHHQNWFYHFTQLGSVAAKEVAVPLVIGLYGATGLAIINNVLKADIARKTEEEIEPSKFILPVRSHALMVIISSFMLFFATSWHYQNLEEGKVIVSAAIGILYFGWRITVMMDNPNYTTIKIFKMLWQWLKK